MSTREERQARFQEFTALMRLPFMSKEQYKRYKELKRQRVKDNREAFEEGTKCRT